jgi:pimeloyl-ACP methyl ester carboxylesterase
MNTPGGAAAPEGPSPETVLSTTLRPDLEGSGWRVVSRFFAAAGRMVGRAAVRAGGAVSAAYHSIDPDLRRHIAQLPVMGLTALASRRGAAEPLPDDGHRPVVFLHGLGGYPGNFLPMRLFFRLSGRRRVYAPPLPAGEPLDVMAAYVGKFLEEVARQNALPVGAKIDIVAHSMGGVVARLALFDPEVAARVGALVTLGTPHAGTHAARYAHTPHTLALRPDSPLMAKLRAQLPWAGPPSLPKLVALFSGADLLLLPHDTARVEGAENVEIRGATHYGYLLDPACFTRVLAALSQESPARD